MKKIILFFILFDAVYCNAQTWDSVGGGITWVSSIRPYLSIQAMVNDTIHHYLYVGGEFDSAGHMPIQNLARWDGKNWSGIGNFNDTCIFALCMYNDTLVIGDYLGNVTFVDSAGNILNIFSTDGFVNALITYKNELYVGGNFDEINGVSAEGIARYNGAIWESVDGGMQNCCGNGENWALYVWNDKLYAGGSYYRAGDSLANNIASWNDTSWAPLGGGTDTRGTGGYNDGYIYSIGSYDNNLYIGGEFDSAGGVSVKYIARWNGIKWDSVGVDINNIPYGFFTYKNYLYMSGFDTAGGIGLRNLAKWNDTVFSSVDSGINGFALAIDTFDNEIYFAGRMNYAGNNLPINNIVRLNVDSVTTAIKTLKKNNEQLTIFPNPSLNQLTFNSTFPIFELQIENVLGQTLLDEPFNYSLRKRTIDVSNLPSGIYFYKITTVNSQNVTGKFVKE